MSETFAVLDQLHLLLIATRTYGEHHPSTEAAATNLATAVRNASPPFAFQFVVGAVFRDRELVPVDGDRYDRVVLLAEAFHRGGAQEITFLPAALPEDFVLLATHLQAGKDKLLDDVGLTSVAFREIPDAKPGEEMESVEPEIFVAAQLVLGFRAARACVSTTPESVGAPPAPWPFSLAMEAVRRLERAMETHVSATAYTLEIAPGALDVGRRAVMAAHHVRVVTTALSLARPLARAAAHAGLAVAVCGLAARGGVEFAVAVKQAAARTALAIDATSADPHRLLVAALLNDHEGRHHLPIIELIHLAYELERGRCPVDVEFDLGLADVLAGALSHWNLLDSPMAPWVRVRVAAAGVMPAGARVRLADGRRGIVLGPGSTGDPGLPMVLVGGQVIEATEPPILEGTPMPLGVDRKAPIAANSPSIKVPPAVSSPTSMARPADQLSVSRSSAPPMVSRSSIPVGRPKIRLSAVRPAVKSNELGTAKTELSPAKTDPPLGLAKTELSPAKTDPPLGLAKTELSPAKTDPPLGPAKTTEPELATAKTELSRTKPLPRDEPPTGPPIESRHEPKKSDSGATRPRSAAPAVEAPIRGTRAGRDPRRDSTGPRLAPVPASALERLEREALTTPSQPAKRPLRREDT